MMRIKIIAACLVLGLVLPSVQQVRAASPSELLEKAIYTEETKGELKAAIDIYQQILQRAADPALLAQAQLRLGLCELKLGNKPLAASMLERLTQQYPNGEHLLSILENRMPQMLDDMVRKIEKNYILEVDRAELIETALRAIVGKLGVQSALLRSNDMAFLGASEVSQLNESIEQKVAGIGAALKHDKEAGHVVVTTPLPHSPALKGGLRAGDRIVEVDGIALPEDKSVETAVRLLRGTPGSPVAVAIRREGSPELIELRLVRDTVRLPSVKGDSYKADLSWEFMLDDSRKIGYVRLTQLGKESPNEMKAALDELSSLGMKALILDLRNNPGGTLADAVSVADLFVENGRIVTVKRRAGETAFDAVAEGTVPWFPMAVLVNRQTASAAEIVAACLQDHRRAVVVGERTFGQALVRSIVPLEGGTGALKLPVAAYVRPSGKTMNRFPEATEADDWGVHPDEGFAISLTDEELKLYEKSRNERDVLRPDGVAVAFHDVQLQKALDYLTGRTQ